jgi:serpin B
MMHQSEKFLYMDNDQVQVLELPYEGGGLSMVIILPKQADGFAELEESFHVKKYKDWISKLSPWKVDVTLPRFKATFEVSLSAALAEMGISEALSGSADFSGMSDEKRGLQISDVIHKAFIDVDEEGTVAAAVTAVSMEGGTARSEEPVSFVADHPFLYVIRDRHSDSILFMGRVIDPDVGARQVADVLSGVWSEVLSQAVKKQKDIHTESQDAADKGK